MMEYGVLLFLAIGQGLKMLSDFEILTWQTMEKSQNVQYIETVRR